MDIFCTEKKWHLLNTWALKAKITVSQDLKLLQQASRDFGHLIEGACFAVAQPKTEEEVGLLLRFANQHGFSLTPRAYGLSQSGQAISPKETMTLDLFHLKEVIEIQPESLFVRCQANISWRQLIEKLLPHDLVPKVIPLNPDLSVAGTISIGGLGSASHRYGPIIHNVIALTVITGAGEKVFCSAEKDSDLFHACLAGVGHFAVITEVTLALRKVKPRVRTFYLLYTDHQQWLSDQENLMQTQRGDYLEAYCSASIQGLRQTPQGRRPFAHWFYCMQLSFEYSDKAPEENEVLQGLRYWKRVHHEDLEIQDYINRYTPRFDLMHKSGAWDLPHPWLECLLPIKGVFTLLPKLLNHLPLSLGDGHRILFVPNLKNNESFFMPPEHQEAAALFAVLPVGIPDYALPETLDTLRELHEMLMNAGGKRYLSGWLGMMNEGDWQRHFGEKYPHWLAAKKKFDPKDVLKSCLFS